MKPEIDDRAKADGDAVLAALPVVGDHILWSALKAAAAFRRSDAAHRRDSPGPPPEADEKEKPR